MKESTKNKIQESIKGLESIGGLKNNKMKTIIDKLKLVVDNKGNSKK